jgi:hypothetical protein
MKTILIITVLFLLQCAGSNNFWTYYKVGEEVLFFNGDRSCQLQNILDKDNKIKFNISGHIYYNLWKYRNDTMMVNYNQEEVRSLIKKRNIKSRSNDRSILFENPELISSDTTLLKINILDKTNLEIKAELQKLKNGKTILVLRNKGKEYQTPVFLHDSIIEIDFMKKTICENTVKSNRNEYYWKFPIYLLRDCYKP